MRVSVVAACLSISLIGFSIAGEAHASIRKQTNIPAEGLGPALNALAKERNFQIVYVTEEIANVHTEGAVGEFTTEEALKRLLIGTGLTYRYLDDKTVTIGSATSPQERSGRASQTTSSGSSDDTSANQEGKKSSSSGFLLAQANQGVAQSSSTVGSDAHTSARSSENSPQLTEILVTAQKKTEREQDVPLSMTVLDPQTLAENGQNRLVDYFASVPGLNLSSNANGAGTNYLTIRGISAGFNQNPIVSTVIDDVPTTSSVQRGYGGLTSPDLDPSDLARIEVLKGPQGTLYGADSLGGLIKYVTIDPSTDAWSGRTEVVGVDLPDGGVGYAVRGAVNVPVSDTLALRISGFDRRDPGYIDDLTTGQRNFNSSDVYGGHVAALWKPLENFSVKLSGLVQDAHGDESYFNSNISGQSIPPGSLGLTTERGTTPYSTQDQFYSATVNWKVAGLEITSVSGYVVNTIKNVLDYTAFFGSSTTGAPYLTEATTHKVSEELRVGSSIGSWLDWRLGGFYTHEDAPNYIGDIYSSNPATGGITGLLYGVNDTTQVFHEDAVFGDLTVHFTDRFDVELGGRQSWNKQEDQIVANGTYASFIAGTPVPFVFPFTEASGSAFTYQVTPRFKISPDLMVYARIATGYRIGGYNSDALTPVNAPFKIPLTFAPDKTTNYELGIKGDLLEHALSFAASAYYIDWKNFQTMVNNIVAPGSDTLPPSYTANAGNAKSEGLELSLEAHPLQGLTITAQGSYDNAVLTQNIPGTAIYGVAGEQLPYSMRFSGGLTVNQEIPLSIDWKGFVGGSLNYVDSRPYEFTASASQPRIEYPAYTQFNLRTGARYQSWLINLYLNNVADRRGVVGINPSYSLNSPAGYNATIIQPRTVGLGISKTF